MKSPVITPELLDWLESLFPDRCPRSAQYDYVLRKMGQQEVMDKIRYTFRQQQKDILRA